ncbi:MAG: peptide chain release factor-like protein [Candidatus Shikimatogenerans sp. AspAUS03]|uniref:Peptide chain release factor-like protein n=1 Tax=Candidatus Shikimatogenerans sp. AspAUS03 TaxID=3158563 RepID=A0AAU7QUG6_9FLAO
MLNTIYLKEKILKYFLLKKKKFLKILNKKKKVYLYKLINLIDKILIIYNNIILYYTYNQKYNLKNKYIIKIIYKNIDKINKYIYIYSILLNKLKYSKKKIIIGIYSLLGGIDSYNCIYLLYKMYFLYSKKQNIKFKIIKKIKIKNKYYKYIFIKLKKKNVLNYFFLEKGIHKFIRLSSINKKKRQTSLIIVNIFLYKKNNIITINPKYLKYKTFRSKGKGGQNVNKVETGIKILYKKYIITYSKTRSQFLNKKKALKLLYKKILLNNIYKNSIKKKNIYLNNKKYTYKKRSYILFPYLLLKDNIVNFKSNKIYKILKGNINIIYNYYYKNKYIKI